MDSIHLPLAARCNAICLCPFTGANPTNIKPFYIFAAASTHPPPQNPFFTLHSPLRYSSIYSCCPALPPLFFSSYSISSWFPLVLRTRLHARLCQEFPIPNMPNTHTHIASPSNDTPHGHHKPYPGKPPPTSSSQHHIPFPNHYHYDYRIPSVFTTNQPPPSLQHQRTQPPIPIKDPPNPTGTHDPRHGDLGHLGHTGQGPFGTTVNHAPSLFIHKRIPST